MLRLHCTKKLLERIGLKPAIAGVAPPDSTAALTSWYATVLFWKPQVALLVNERTLLPVLMPLSPAISLAARFPTHLADVLALHGWQPDAITRELRNLNSYQIVKTANRSVLGSLNEFVFLAEVYMRHDGNEDLRQLSAKLALTPCKPIGYESPSALLAAIAAGDNTAH